MIIAIFLLLAQTVTPPQPIETLPAAAPEGAPQAVTVVLLVNIGVAGTVENVSVAESGGQALDGAAIAAVMRWKFWPALRDGVPFEARVRIPFHFEAAPAAGQVPQQPLPQQTSPQQPLPQQASPAPPEPSPPAPAAEQLQPQSDQTAPRPGERVEDVTVRGYQRKVEHGGSDFVIDVGQLAVVPRKNAENLLELAPGIFLTNEGGEGHAEQVFLRGFNAQQGQAIEFSVGGVPINEVDNPDSHGYADTHFIIPELIKGLQVTEGPFDPRQGDFAVAGSARYDLGVKDRGMRFSGGFGSYGARRYLALWAPEGEREGTFAAAQFSNGNGYGDNRAYSNASAMGQYEGELGLRGLFRILAATYTTHYKSAGTVRADDVADGRIGYYGSEDPSQGGDAVRHTLSFDLEAPLGNGTASAQVFLTYRTLRITENFTGFLLDTPQAGQSSHGQRGDEVQKDYEAFTAGSRGSDRLRFRLLGRDQTVEAGYYARYDHTTPSLFRLRFGTQVPYLNDLDLVTDTVNLAGYIDVELKPLSFLTLRGGLRQELFEYDIEDLCSTRGNFKNGEPFDEECPAYDRTGPRSPDTRVTATGQILEPKATVLVDLPYKLQLTASYGVGASSLDPISVEQDENAPFVKLTAYEAGVLAKGTASGFEWNARLVGYQTKIGQDLIFNPDLGRLSPSSPSTRTGIVAAARATSHFLDEAISFTTTHPSFDTDGTLVPYTPLLIGRSDTALNANLPIAIDGHQLHGSLGFGAGYIGKRSLPFSQFSSPTLQLDAQALVRYRFLKFGAQVTNLTNTQFPSSEFFFASDFHSRNYPTLAPAAHFTAAPPRLFLFTVEIALGSETL
jgi:iron complex outermembrane receptor protein